MNQYAPQALPSPIARQQKKSPTGIWGKAAAFMRGAEPFDPIRYRLDRLDDISLRTWLPAPLREEIGRSVAQGTTIMAIRTSGSLHMDPWDMERAAAIWCTEADGIIHKCKWFSSGIGLAEVVLTLGALIGILFLALLMKGEEPLESAIKGMLPTEWLSPQEAAVRRCESIPDSTYRNDCLKNINITSKITAPQPAPSASAATTKTATLKAPAPAEEEDTIGKPEYIADLFINKLRLATIASAATLVIAIAVLLLWSRGPRRWGVVLAICICAPAITIFAALGYTLAHQINQYHQSILERERREVVVINLEESQRQKRVELAQQTTKINALHKDIKAYTIAEAAVKSGVDTQPILTRIAANYAVPTGPSNNDDEGLPERKLLKSIINASLNASLETLTQQSKALPQPTGQIAPTQAAPAKSGEKSGEKSEKTLSSHVCDYLTDQGREQDTSPQGTQTAPEQSASRPRKSFLSHLCAYMTDTGKSSKASEKGDKTPYFLPPPQQISEGQDLVKDAKARALARQKVIREIEYLSQLKQMLESTKEQVLTNEVVNLAIEAAASKAAHPNIRAALLDYFKDLIGAAQTAVTEEDKRHKDLVGEMSAYPSEIKIADEWVKKALKRELKDYSTVKNSLGDVSDMIVASSPASLSSDNQGSTGATLNAINNINNAKQVVLSLVFALLMIVCANEVVFVTSVGVSVLLLPVLIHSVVGLFGAPIRARSRWHRPVANTLMAVGAAMLLYWIGSGLLALLVG
ncbi:MAG: hypothetical protein FD176_1072 [Rhodospirillaceae bacterium]|nr:MAG: hypothetical protein FD176_1072 [Rhodospirillaceae bacterium]TNC97168.1 MAG: hypothetical protein FD119_1260 [Stygiobacter sp.]